MNVSTNFPAPRPSAEVTEYLWKNETLPRMRAAGLPDRFLTQLDFANCLGQRSAYRRAWKLCCGVGSVVALVGPRGTGKTSIAAQLIRSRAECESLEPWNRQPPYRKLTDIIARFKPLYADFGSIDAETLMRSRDKYVSISLHIIDEVHECQDQKLKDRMLTDIIDRCYSSRTDVVLISNQTAEEFQQTTSDSILSRLSQHGQIIPCDWKSFRTPL